jgi:hypothetical protein
MPQVRAVFASLIAFCLSVSGLLAQAGKADATSGKSAVNVRSIHFDPVKLGGQQNPWIRTQVELHANFNPAATAAAGEAEAGPKKPINKTWVDKVKVTLRFRGREMVHSELGLQVLNRVRGEMDPLTKIESMPRMEGRQMIMVLAPK